MGSERRVAQAWAALPLGARVALQEQWAGLAAGGLPCGSTILAADGGVLSAGHNRAYDPPGGIETRAQSPLQHTRLAHAELNALALVPTEFDHATLTLWTTQHPCPMCAAACAFIAIGKVCYIADDPSDESPPDALVATRGRVAYEALGDPLWWTISNLLFLYASAIRQGEAAHNLRINRGRYPELVRLTLVLAQGDGLGAAARSGATLPDAVEPHAEAIEQVAHFAPTPSAR
jgi:tRNA(Arg) A34 adenosine deaminase TadA